MIKKDTGKKNFVDFSQKNAVEIGRKGMLYSEKRPSCG